MSVYCCKGLTATSVMVKNQYDPLCGSVCNVDLNVSVAAKHAPEIESCIRTIEEPISAQKSCLPFSGLPVWVVISLVSFFVLWINPFPHKNSVFCTLSPCTIITRHKLDYTKHCFTES